MTSLKARLEALSRREFLNSSGAAVAAAAAPWAYANAASAARYTRYSVTSREGQVMLDSFRKAIMVMLDLKPEHPHNWFRNAFVHTMDCPHHNWWFLVWHRGYIGWFERTVRRYSGNRDFSFPYWDWSETPKVPNAMFAGVLTPTDGSYDRYISTFKTFQDFIQPAMANYYKSFTATQNTLLRERGMATTGDLWAQVVKRGMYATTKHARFPSRTSPDLDAKTTDATSKLRIDAILKAPSFEEFNSGQTSDHGQMSKDIAALEGTPHDLTHNFCGGVGYVPNDQMGFMQDNLSPSDPLFFLHHSNMDRLYQIWIRRQIAAGRSYLPKDEATFKKEPFPFFFNEEGKPLLDATAADYIDIGKFDYDYAPGTNSTVVAARVAAVPGSLRRPLTGAVNGGVASIAVPAAALAKDRVLVAEVTIPNPATIDSPREFLVLANAPSGTMTATPDNPYYIGAVAFFGFVPGMGGETTFSVPIPADKQSKLTAGPLRIQAVSAPGLAQVQAAAPGAKQASLRAAAPSPMTAASLTVW